MMLLTMLTPFDVAIAKTLTGVLGVWIQFSSWKNENVGMNSSQEKLDRCVVW